MKVAALSLAGLNLSNLDQYRHDLEELLKQSAVELVVLPAYSSLLLGLNSGYLKKGSDFSSTVIKASSDQSKWYKKFLDIHGDLARSLGIYLVAGTIIEECGPKNYHTACCFNPQGEICRKQRQTHLSSVERDLGLSRGVALDTFSIGEFTVGLLVGTDSRHPETGRIYALRRGIDLLLYCGAVEGFNSCWSQAAGIWAQVQQNQFWAVEAQLYGSIGGKEFGASSAVIGPCEITPGKSGYLARGYPGTTIVCADLIMSDLTKIREKYPLLKLLNMKAYTGNFKG